LRPDPQNANRGTPRGRALIATSLETYGAGRSVLTDRDGVVIAGNKTVEEAKALNLPIRVVDTTGAELVVARRIDLRLSRDARARALAVADNRTSELDLEWDPAILQQLQGDGLDLTPFWTNEELEQLVRAGIHPGATEDDHVLAPRPTTIRRGDQFRLGEHYVRCGDATDAMDVERVLRRAQPILMVTDAPYGVRYDPAWRHRRYPRQRTAVGSVLHDDRVDWTAAYQLFGGDVVYVWHAGVSAAAVAASLEAASFVIRSQIIWAKQHFALSRGEYHWQHEPCWYAVRRGARSHWQGDRTQSTLWAVPNLNAMGGVRDDENTPTGHSTQKPVRLFERAILNHTAAGDAIYDPFVGSGTALIAAQKTGRRAYVMDLDPVYVQTTIDRWEAYTGKKATPMSVKGRRR
jgi:DNA modification methylase